jgi:hypothetical protein
MAGGRPKKYKDDSVSKLAEDFKEYIDTTDIPIIAEFAYMNDIDRTLLYDREVFSTLIKKCIAKKEAQLEKMSLKGEVNTTQAIFSLKQLGWKDKQEQSITFNPANLTDEEIEALIKKMITNE